MHDLIKLLPNSVANQIAAGEVIQRPASVVKELLENSIDAQATEIKLIIKDSGKALIQVIDNGKGMSETDARMCFERHATSKIAKAEDLFSLNTFGFRGEALASVAAVAQVELRTMQEGQTIGTEIFIEASKVVSQENTVMSGKGTIISVKNLFYNIPARRNFLKSDNVEFRHIFEEFNRVAFIHPEIKFTFLSDDKSIAMYINGTLSERIIQISGNHLKDKLFPIKLETEYVQIEGFIAKPEAATKSRGDQYFFANGRFIKHAYLNHAVEQAYKELIPDYANPKYFIFITVNPNDIDVNIHPTKTEISFRYNQIIYTSLRTAVKHSLGMFTLSPQLNFDTIPAFDVDPPKNYVPKQPSVILDPNYNPFNNSKQSFNNKPSTLKPNVEGWEKLYDGLKQAQDNTFVNLDAKKLDFDEKISETKLFEKIDFSKSFQILNKYFVLSINNELVIIDQQKAHQRVLYEYYLKQFKNKTVAPQKLLFPLAINISPSDSLILQEILPELTTIGLELTYLGDHSFGVISVPGDIKGIDIETVIISFLQYYKDSNIKPNQNDELNRDIAASLAKASSIREGQKLLQEEMVSILQLLFDCESPNSTIEGSKTFIILNENEIASFFK